jgi:hypothetical protein
MTLWSQFLSRFGRQRPADPLIRPTHGGFSLIQDNSQAVLRTVLWSSVAKIQTYKRDFLTTDCICLLFELQSADPPVQVSEEWDGFADLLASMSKALPTIPANWYVEVMTPPFAEKRTLLYAVGSVENAA